MLLTYLVVSLGEAEQAPTYKLYARKGDWAEYVVLTARGLVMLSQHMLDRGDKLRLVLTGTNTTPVRMPNGSVAFYMEQPLCDIYLNGEKVAERTSMVQEGRLVLPMLPFTPAEDAFWADLRNVIAAWNRTLREEGNCTVEICRFEETADEVRIVMGITNTTGGLFPAISSYRCNCTYDRQAGVLKAGYYHARVWALFVFLEVEFELKLTVTNLELAGGAEPSGPVIPWEQYELYVISGVIAIVTAVAASWLIAKRYWKRFLSEVMKVLADI